MQPPPAVVYSAPPHLHHLACITQRPHHHLGITPRPHPGAGTTPPRRPTILIDAALAAKSPARAMIRGTSR
jgi:hypothetical protein